MTLQILPKPDTESNLVRDLRASLEAGTVTWALIQADFALKGRPIPEKLSDVHPHERRLYEDRACAVLMACNLDAERYAQSLAPGAAWDLFERWCGDRDLDWATTHPANTDDGVELLIDRMSHAVIARYLHTLSGLYGHLSQYLASVERGRSGGGR
jgi:hypothetical protein